jgi:ABC-type Fe3+ transport system substrate-binding protein
MLIPKPEGEPKPATSTPVAIASPAPEASPVAGVVAAEGEKIVMLYDGGAEEWVKPAADAFNAKNEGKVGISVTRMGSREGRDHILYDKDKVHPTLWNPGDSYWTDKLKMDSADAKIPAKSGATAGEVQPLLRTYFVLLMPVEKAKVFEAAMVKPEYSGKTWTLLHDLATKGWSAAGAPADWGKLKLAQADPTKANSGMTTLVLMYQEWAKANPGKSINDKGFLQWMIETQSAVTTFADSTSELMRDFISEPGKADIALVYESEAVRALESGAKDLKIVYPSPTVALTLPIAMVEASWVSENQATVGKEFMEYLLSESVQEQALQYGYRPASESLSAKVKETFGAKSAMGVVVEPVLAEDVDTKTKEGLIFNWNEWFKKR